MNLFGINFLESQSGRSQKFVLRKVYVKHSLHFITDEGVGARICTCVFWSLGE